MAFVKEDKSVQGIFDWIEFLTHRGLISFGRRLQPYKGRTLGGIQFTIEKTSKNNKSYRFTRSSTETPPSLELNPCSGLSEVGNVGSEGSEGSESPDGADFMEIPGGLYPEGDVSSFISPKGEMTSPTSPTSPRGSRSGCELDLDKIASDLTSGEKSLIALTVDTEGSTPRDGEIRRLSLHREGGLVWTIDPATIGYDLGPLIAALGPEGSSRILVSDAHHSLRWLRVKCGLRIRRVSCLATARQLLTAGGNIDGTPSRLPDSRPDAVIELLHEEHTALCREIEEARLTRVWELESRILPVVVEMEARGCRVDVGELRRIEEDSRLTTDRLGAELRAALGDPEFDLDNSEKLLNALQGAGLVLTSTSKGDLIAADDGHLVPLVLKCRQAHSRSQQAKNLLRHVDQDNRIHARFDPLGAVTGRFSSKDPCLQNIARGELRRAFVASPGHLLVIADYAQVELRAAAVIAEDETLIEMFNRGKDPYREMAGELYGKREKEVTPKERRIAKTLSLSLLNGSGTGRLDEMARESGLPLSPKEAAQLLSTFRQKYAGIREWHEAIRTMADGFPRTHQLDLSPDSVRPTTSPSRGNQGVG